TRLHTHRLRVCTHSVQRVPNLLSNQRNRLRRSLSQLPPQRPQHLMQNLVTAHHSGRRWHRLPSRRNILRAARINPPILLVPDRLRTLVTQRLTGALMPPSCRDRPARLQLPRHNAPPITSSNQTRSPVTATYRDRKSTRLNSSHVKISYAVFCLKK